MKIITGAMYIHASGNVYKLLMVTNSKATKQAFIETAVYEDKRGDLWSRPLTEFKEKFILK